MVKRQRLANRIYCYQIVVGYCYRIESISQDYPSNLWVLGGQCHPTLDSVVDPKSLSVYMVSLEYTGDFLSILVLSLTHLDMSSHKLWRKMSKCIVRNHPPVDSESAVIVVGVG